MKIAPILLTVLSLVMACRTATAPEAAVPALSISDIQGPGHRSPYEGKVVSHVRGIVTAVQPGGRTPGFWMEERRPGGGSAASTGIFISVRDARVAAGDDVAVSGTVEEAGTGANLTTTRIAAAEVSVVSSGNAMPAAVVLGKGGREIPRGVIEDDGMNVFDPQADALDFWETLEGMRVEVRDAVVVGPTSEYGDLVVLADNGASSSVRSLHGGIVLQRDDENPERITIEPRLVAKPPAANVGARFEQPIAGVVDYGFGGYRVLNTQPLAAPASQGSPQEVTSLAGTDAKMTIATYNVLNLSATSPEEKFTRLGRTIAVNLGAPDVVALEEIQDDDGARDDGVVTAAKTLEKLTSAITGAGGPRYSWREIDPLDNQDGGQPGGNIRVVILFNPQRIEFVDRGHGGSTDPVAVEGTGASASLTLSPGRIEPGNPCFAGGGAGALAEPTRKSLAAEVRFNGRRVFVIANHLKSKRGDDPPFGRNQPPGFLTEEQRICQAEIVGRFAASILQRDPGAAIVVLGDMNEHEFRPPILRLAATSGMTNLIERVPIAERYTFNFGGNSQVLDHILVSPSILGRAPEIDIVHVNADRADSLAASDHDPVLARITP